MTADNTNNKTNSASGDRICVLCKTHRDGYRMVVRGGNPMHASCMYRHGISLESQPSDSNIRDCGPLEKGENMNNQEQKNDWLPGEENIRAFTINGVQGKAWHDGTMLIHIPDDGSEPSKHPVFTDSHKEHAKSEGYQNMLKRAEQEKQARRTPRKCNLANPLTGKLADPHKRPGYTKLTTMDKKQVVEREHAKMQDGTQQGGLQRFLDVQMNLKKFERKLSGRKVSLDRLFEEGK